MHKYDLTGKQSLITGALGLLGPEWAIALLECGADVILTDKCELSDEKVTKAYQRIRQDDIGQRQTGRGALRYIKMDVTNINDVATVASEQNIDILVNNAALDPKVQSDGVTNSSRFENMFLDDWRAGMSVTLEGTFICCQQFGNQMIQYKKPGTIINIASELSFLSPDQRLYEKDNVDPSQQNVKPVTYMVAKAGVVALTKYLATYPAFLQNKIRVNALSPSGVYNNHPQDFVEKLSSRIPLGRMANRDEYRGALQFLASDASSYMNGHNLILDGGKSLW